MANTMSTVLTIGSLAMALYIFKYRPDAIWNLDAFKQRQIDEREAKDPTMRAEQFDARRASVLEMNPNAAAILPPIPVAPTSSVPVVQSAWPEFGQSWHPASY